MHLTSVSQAICAGRCFAWASWRGVQAPAACQAPLVCLCTTCLLLHSTPPPGLLRSCAGGGVQPAVQPGGQAGAESCEAAPAPWCVRCAVVERCMLSALAKAVGTFASVGRRLPVPPVLCVRRLLCSNLPWLVRACRRAGGPHRRCYCLHQLDACMPLRLSDPSLAFLLCRRAGGPHHPPHQAHAEQVPQRAAQQVGRCWQICAASCLPTCWHRTAQPQLAPNYIADVLPRWSCHVLTNHSCL